MSEEVGVRFISELRKFRIFVIPLYEFSKDLKMTGISMPLKSAIKHFKPV